MKTRWNWKCCWETLYFGKWHPDYEGCNAQGKHSYKIKENAFKAGEKHFSTHKNNRRYWGDVVIFKTKIK